MDEQLRLQVFLSRNGVCSRRDAIGIIQSGNVTVNGHKILEPSYEVDLQRDKIKVDGKMVRPRPYEYIMFHKPAGYVTTKTAQGRQKTIYDALPKQCQHLLPVGRLDKETEGLLILTNNGDISHALTHPKFSLDKTYFVILKGRLDSLKKSKIEKGVYIEGGKTAPAKISQLRYEKNDTLLKITIHEGKKRQIRYMFARVKYMVKYLKRLTQGPLSLGTLKVGKSRPLTKLEIESLKKLL
ncbi:MAG: pseudouridine synthase [Lysobacterales bacterium]|jgi:pseudouridine synthase